MLRASQKTVAITLPGDGTVFASFWTMFSLSLIHIFQLDFQEESLAIIQGRREVWEDPIVNNGWIHSIEIGTVY